MIVVLELVRDSLYSIIFHLAPRLANVIVFVLIGRLAGPREAGIFTLASTYLLIFTTVMRGLDDLLVRQVSREPDATHRYFASFIGMRLVLSLLAYTIIVAVVQIGIPYEAETVDVILVLSLSLFTDSLTFVVQSILLGRRHFRPPAIVLASVSILKAFGGTLVILMEGTVISVAWVWVIGSGLGFFLMLAVTLWQIGLPSVGLFRDWSLVRRHSSAIIFFFALTALASLETQSDTILLSGFAGEIQVGWYGAATTVTYSLLMFSQAYRFAVYPRMAKHALDRSGRLQQLHQVSVKVLGLLVLPMVGGIFILSERIVALIFGPNFAPIVPTLRILVLSLISIFLNEPNVRVLLVSDRQQRLFVFLLASALVNVGLNVLLIPDWETLGAATARVTSSLILFMLCYQDVTRHVIRQNVLRVLVRPGLATAAMLAVVFQIREGPLLVVVILGVIVYGIALLLTGAVSLSQLRNAYYFLGHRRSMPSGL